jgi:hypothetical protein
MGLHSKNENCATLAGQLHSDNSTQPWVGRAVLRHRQHQQPRGDDMATAVTYLQRCVRGSRVGSSLLTGLATGHAGGGA